MSRPDALGSLPPIPGEGRDEGEGPVFAEPWHAQLFAITVRLSEAGHFDWPEWAERFAARLKAASEAGAPKDGSAYFDVWLETLEALLGEKGLTGAEDLAALKAAWTQAYLDTPHGKPVRLNR